MEHRGSDTTTEISKVSHGISRTDHRENTSINNVKKSLPLTTYPSSPSVDPHGVWSSDPVDSDQSWPPPCTAADQLKDTVGSDGGRGQSDAVMVTSSPSGGSSTFSSSVVSSTFSPKGGLPTFSPVGGSSTFSSNGGPPIFSPSGGSSSFSQGSSTFSSSVVSSTYSSTGGSSSFSSNGGSSSFSSNGGSSSFSSNDGSSTFSPNGGSSPQFSFDAASFAAGTSVTGNSTPALSSELDRRDGQGKLPRSAVELIVWALAACASTTPTLSEIAGHIQHAVPCYGALEAATVVSMVQHHLHHNVPHYFLPVRAHPAHLHPTPAMARWAINRQSVQVGEDGAILSSNRRHPSRHRPSHASNRQPLPNPSFAPSPQPGPLYMPPVTGDGTSSQGPQGQFQAYYSWAVTQNAGAPGDQDGSLLRRRNRPHSFKLPTPSLSASSRTNPLYMPPANNNGYGNSHSASGQIHAYYSNPNTSFYTNATSPYDPYDKSTVWAGAPGVTGGATMNAYCPYPQ